MVLVAHGMGDVMEHTGMLMHTDAGQRMESQVKGEDGDGQQKMAHPAGTQRTLSTPHRHHDIRTVSAVFRRGNRLGLDVRVDMDTPGRY